MQSAHALALVAFVLLVLAPALAAPAPQNPGSPPSDPSCSAQSRSGVWSSCTTEGDYRATNLTLAGHATIAGALDASDATLGAARVQGELRAQSLVAAQDVVAPHATFGDLRLDGGASARTLQLQAATLRPECVEGTIIVQRTASGADALQACLRGASGTLAWVALASG